jgi:hypothetical protein
MPPLPVGLLLLRLLPPALVLSDCGSAAGVAGAASDTAAGDCCSGGGLVSSPSAGEAARTGRVCRDGGGCCWGLLPMAPFIIAAVSAACGGCCRRFCCAVCWPRDCGLLVEEAPLPPLLLGAGRVLPLLLRGLLGGAESAPE